MLTATTKAERVLIIGKWIPKQDGFKRTKRNAFFELSNSPTGSFRSQKLECLQCSFCILTENEGNVVI